MRGWASLQPTAPPDDPALARFQLRGAALDALAFVEKEGPLRVYGSWRDGEVKVGLHDPARIVDRVDVWVEDTEGNRVRLRRGVDGRLRYKLDAEVERSVVIEAVFVGVRGVVLAQTRLAPSAAPVALPAAPDPKALRDRLDDRPLKRAPQPAGSQPAVRWWWVVAGIAAAALTGTAIVQELQ